MRNFLKKTVVTMLAAAMLVSGAAISAGAETLPEGSDSTITAETLDTPVIGFMDNNGGIVPFSATDSRIDHDVVTSKFTAIGNPRLKEDTTSAYAFITSTLYNEEPIKAQIWGCSYEKNILGKWVYKWEENCTVNIRNQLTEYVRLYINTQYQIYNCVGEHNYSYAGLKLRSTNRNCHVMGYWSPDSVNTSGMPVAN